MSETSSAPTGRLSQLLLKAAPDGLLVVDAGGIVRYANSAAHELFDRPAGRLIGQPFGYPTAAQVTDVQLVLEDGSLRTVELRSASSIWRGTEVTVIALRDITQRHQREQQLHEALEERDLLAAELAHEVGTPLAVITGTSELLRERWAQLPDNRRQDLVARIGRQAERLDRLIRRVLQVAVLESEAGAPAPTPVDVWEVKLSNLPDLGVASVHVDCPEGLRVIADPGHLDEIVVNLVENAAKYGHPPIVVTGRRTDNRVELRVSDQGPGVPEEFLPRLFERFSRAGLPEHAQRGTGLGLYLARRLARANGGDIRYEPNEPRGACFIVELPAG